MIAFIDMPDGSPATLYEDGWYTAYPEAMPVLEYLTGKIPGDISQMNVEQIAKAVVAMMNGARFDCTVIPDGPSTRPTAAEIADVERKFPLVHRISTGAVTPQQGVDLLIAAGDTREQAERIVALFTATAPRAVHAPGGS